MHSTPKKTQYYCVKWHEQPAFDKNSFEYSFITLMQLLEQYKVEKILVKTCKTIIHLPDKEYEAIILLLQSGLAHSRIRKIAHLMVDHSERDYICRQLFRQMLSEMQLKISFRSFDDRAHGLIWLKHEEA